MPDQEVTHRDFVGGMWEELGSLQLDFLVAHGLRPHHVLLDIGCGSLRAGRKLIPYLDPHNYLGLDSEQDLLSAGIESELGRELYEQRRPELIASDRFEFSRFSRQPDFAMCQAVFMFLSEEQIVQCFENLRAVAKDGCRFFATWWQTRTPTRMTLDRHPHLVHGHTRSQMMRFGRRTGWTSRYIGHWNHPRGLVIVEYTAGRSAARSVHAGVSSLAAGLWSRLRRKR